MRRSVIITLSLLFVAAGATAAGVATAGASSAATPKVVVSIVSSSKCKPVSEFCFKPANITVASGTRVVFSNKTLTTHTVTRCAAVACAGNSGGTGMQTGFGATVMSGAKYTFVFRKVGTYLYYCQIHGYATMHGMVTVTKS